MGRRPKPIESPANRIRELRLAAGLSLEQLGVAIGVGYEAVREYETGITSPTLERLTGIAKALGVRVTDLLNESAA